MRVRLAVGLRQTAWTLAAVALVLGQTSCSLDQQKEGMPVGPSETGVSAQLFALPDTVNADGVSQAVVKLVLYGPSGETLSGRAVLFDLTTGDGVIAPSAASTFVGPVQRGIVMATAADGTADVVYTAGFARTIATIAVRPYSFDATRNYLSFIEIIQR